MVELARQKNVFFMEAVWSRTFPLYDALTERLSSLGQPCNMVLTFGQAGNHLPDQRLAWKKNGGGTVLDFGVTAYSWSSTSLVLRCPLESWLLGWSLMKMVNIEM